VLCVCDDWHDELEEIVSHWLLHFILQLPDLAQMQRVLLGGQRGSSIRVCGRVEGEENGKGGGSEGWDPQNPA